MTSPPSDFFEDETADETRVRLSKQYIAAIEGDAEEKRKRIKLELDAKNRKTSKNVADNFTLGPAEFRKGHLRTCTSVCVKRDESKIYSGGKDCAVLEWDMETGKKVVFSGGRKKYESSSKRFRCTQVYCH